MTPVEQVLISIASAVGGGFAWHWLKRWVTNAQKGKLAEEHAQFVTREEMQKTIADQLGGLPGDIERLNKAIDKARALLDQEHSQFVTKADCERCQAGHVNEMTAGNDLFRLLLEGQSLHTQGLLHLCNQDDGCRELRAKLQDYLARLATRQTRGR